MLLRRFTEHVRDQNWFAVAIDFAIVVFGVYVGLQTQEWSELKALEASESQYLTELREEILHNATLTSGNVDAMRTMVSSGNRAIGFLRSDSPCEADCWRLLVDFFTASQVFRPGLSTTVYQETQRLGFPRSRSVSAAVDQYYTQNSMAYLGINNDPKYRLTLRELLPVEAHEKLWTFCHALDGPEEKLIVDCPPAMPADEVKKILDRIRARPEVLDQLNYWIGMHSLWLPYLSDVSVMANTAIEAIDEIAAKRVDS